MKVTKKQNNSHHCLVCGMQNNLGLKAFFYETEEKELVSIFTFKKEHESYPGRAHGGMICSLLDELIGRAYWQIDPNMFGVTISISVKYRKPVPTMKQLKAVARITSETSRTFEGTGEIVDQNGNVLAEASAIYMKMPLSRIVVDQEEDKIDVWVPDDIQDV